MKKHLKRIAVAMGLLSCTPVVLADDNGPATIWNGFNGFFEPDWKQDFSATVGVKVWVNEWTRDSFNSYGSNFNGTQVNFSQSRPNLEISDTEATPIPQLSLRYKWLFFTGSYYAETNFDFPRSQAILSANGLTQVITDNATAERMEWDMAAGFYVHPNIAILAGYKRINQLVNFAREFGFGSPPRIDFRSDLEIEGPTLGIAASMPLGQGFGAYLNYAHGFLTANIRDTIQAPFVANNGQSEHDASYDVAEFGFTYTPQLASLPVHLPLTAATAYAGYRHQSFETEYAFSSTDPSNDRSDITRGFVVGVNLTF